MEESHDVAASDTTIDMTLLCCALVALQTMSFVQAQIVGQGRKLLF
jgi:hypothetical protein